MSRLVQRALILLTTVLLCTALAHAESESGGEQRRIGEIRIEVAPIYTEEQAEKSSWKTFTNRRHIPTRESVIRTELLFKEGDVLDEELLVASERSLRRFQFVNKAEVLVVPVDDETVDVEVRTKEAWTLEPGMNIKGGGGLATVSGHLIEFNLLGLGKKLYGEAIYENDVGTTWKFGYSDYQILKTRWVGNAVYQNGPLIESFFAQARLPLYSPDSTWSYGGSTYKANAIGRLFEDGEESSRYAKDQVQLNSFLRRSFGQRYKKTNLKLGLNYTKIDYSPLGSETTVPPPPDQANVTPTVSIDTGKIEWAKNSYINKMGTTEDDWLGLKYGGTLGYGIPVDDSIELWDVATFVLKNIAFSPQQLMKLNGRVESEVVRNTFVKLGARYYKKFTRHTLATRIRTNFGYDLDSSRQLTLGADSGLRGYPARQFDGERLILMNLEDRQYWGTMSKGPKIALGTVVFVDAGNVWEEEETIDLDELNWSAGFGFRLGLSNMPKQPILRVDLGWAIGGEDSFAVTLGTEQHFR
jgi:outer membrane protein assembly factor BamA